MSNELPVLDDWDGYDFPEESVSSASQRLTVRDPIAKPQTATFAPFRLDNPQDGAVGTMANTAVAVQRELRAGQGGLANIPLHGGNAAGSVHWFQFSPYELFLEQVVAERLKTLEIGDLG